MKYIIIRKRIYRICILFPAKDITVRGVLHSLLRHIRLRIIPIPVWNDYNSGKIVFFPVFWYN